MSIHKRIRDLRKAKGLSQADLADAIGKSLRMVQKYEAEDDVSTSVNPSIEMLHKIADVLEVSILDLIKNDSYTVYVDTKPQSKAVEPANNSPKPKLSLAESETLTLSLDPIVQRYTERIKADLARTYPSVDFTSSDVIQNMIIKTMAEKDARIALHRPHDNSYMEFGLMGGEKVTGKKLYDFLLSHFKQKIQREIDVENAARAERMLQSIESGWAPRGENLEFLRTYYRNTPEDKLPEPARKYLGNPSQEPSKE